MTAFEPSGDTLAAVVIEHLRRKLPGVTVCGLGGPKMAAAGAELLEITTEHAAMGLDAVSQAFEYRRRMKRLRAWMADQKLAAVVPVDSPAANWSVCALARKLQPQARIVHLVAPQLWAWAPWRIRRMRRLSDHVLCLLPFEPKWFGDRGMPGEFVGHPLMGGPRRGDGGRMQTLWSDADPATEPAGGQRLALLPGSRRGEWDANWPMMLRAFIELRRSRPGLRATVAVIHERALERLLDLTAQVTGSRVWPVGLRAAVGAVDDVLEWSTAALVVSGTATLDVTAHRRPMVVVYNLSRLIWETAARWLITTRTFALPNLISESMGEGRIVTEFVPHFGAVGPIAAALAPLLDDPAAASEQVRRLGVVAAVFEGVDFGPRAAEAILRQAGLATS